MLSVFMVALYRVYICIVGLLVLNLKKEYHGLSHYHFSLFRRFLYLFCGSLLWACFVV